MIKSMLDKMRFSLLFRAIDPYSDQTKLLSSSNPVNNCILLSRPFIIWSSQFNLYSQPFDLRSTLQRPKYTEALYLKAVMAFHTKAYVCKHFRLTVIHSRLSIATAFELSVQKTIRKKGFSIKKTYSFQALQF